MDKVKLTKGDAVKHLTNPELIKVCLADGWEKADKPAKPKAKKPAKKEEK